MTGAMNRSMVVTGGASGLGYGIAEAAVKAGYRVGVLDVDRSSMNRQVMKMYAGDCSHLDQKEIGRAVMEWYASSLEKGLATRERMPAELFVDCTQAELSADPIGVVERIYERFGLELSSRSRKAIQAYVIANPKGKHGKHSYDLESFGLSEEDVLSRFAFYLDDDRWPLGD